MTYVATAPRNDDDPEWAARIRRHRDRRPRSWRTVETTDLAAVLANAGGTLLIDSIGTWLTAQFDELAAWDAPSAVEPRIDELLVAWQSTKAHVVAVTDEVGLSIVPATASGRAFRDALGVLNRRLAACSEEAALVVAGRVLELP